MKTALVAAAIIIAAIIGIGIISSPTPQKKETPAMTTTPDKTSIPSMQINPNKTYVAVLQTTAGKIEISLDAKNTPITANNFMSLAKNGFYRNTIFHRVIKGFMIQGGDPNGDGTGGPGYKFDNEPIVGEYTRGTVAMANSGPNTNGSQFFIMHQDNALPKNYVIFGKVTRGIEVIDEIASSPVQSNSSGENSRPVNPASITEITIVEN